MQACIGHDPTLSPHNGSPPNGSESTNRLWTPTEIEERHLALLDYPTALTYLTDKRGLTLNTIKKFKIGIYDKNTFMIPIFDVAGRLMNVRYWRPKDKKKWVIKGRTTKLLFPWNHMNGAPTLWITEGEVDTMLAYQNAIPAIGTTSGAPAAPDTLRQYKSLFAGRTFVIALDNDDAGQKAAAEIGLDIFPGRIDGMVIWPEWCKKGYDISDWFNEGHNFDELNEEYVRPFDANWARKLLGRPQIYSPVVDQPDDSFNLKTMWPCMGFLKEYTEYAATLTDAPDQFHAATALAIMGVATQRQIFYWMGSDQIYPNFYSCLVAPSSIFRKSTALKIGTKLLSRLNSALIMPRDFSTESFLSYLAKTPKGLFAFSEIAELLDQFRRGYSEGLMPIITDFYDCPDLYERRTKKDGLESVKQPFISILGASTVDWLNKNLTVEQAEGGFWPRFLFFSARRRKPLLEVPPAPDSIRENMLLNSLRDISVIAGKVSLTNGALARLREWVKAKSVCASNLVGPAFYKYAARMQPYAIKIAMLFQLSESKSTTVGKECMEKAINLCNWLLLNLEYLISYEFAFSKRDAQDNRVLAFIRDTPLGVTLRDISRRFRLRRKEIEETLDALILREYVGREIDCDGIMRYFPLSIEVE